MKISTKHALWLGLILTTITAFAEDSSKIVPTKNKYADQLSEFLQSNLTFSQQNDSIQIQAKPNNTLPLEFVADKGLEASDGILVVGDSFAWPGCGFDRTSYTIKEITPEFVLIEYRRGSIPRDGYQDSGEMKIILKK